MAALPDDNMGVNLAEITMSVFCYPIGATTYRLRPAKRRHIFLHKNARIPQKYSYESLQRVTQS